MEIARWERFAYTCVFFLSNIVSACDPWDRLAERRYCEYSDTNIVHVSSFIEWNGKSTFQRLTDFSFACDIDIGEKIKMFTLRRLDRSTHMFFGVFAVYSLDRCRIDESCNHSVFLLATGRPLFTSIKHFPSASVHNLFFFPRIS